MNSLINNEYTPGSNEWLNFRKTKITSTDASVIMGISPWKTKLQLYNEKKSNVNPIYINERMQRGIELEPLARDLFILKTGIVVDPEIIVKDWAMASLDGLSKCKKHVVEIKCPGKKDHDLALSGKIPEYYYPQLQHQMYVCDVESMYYFSFDGFDGVTIDVKRDNEFIDKMIKEELKFYECMINNVPPEPDQNEYVEREDELWKYYSQMYIHLCEKIKNLEYELNTCKNELIYMSGEKNTKGHGISLCKINRKGIIDYSKIPEIKNIDLEIYRKPSIDSWRISY